MEKKSLPQFKFILPYIFLFVIVGILAFFILYNCEWLYADIGPIINNLAVGKFMTLSEHIMAYEGRIGPLSGYDYNLLLLLNFSKGPLGYYLLLTIYFLSLVLFLLLTLNKVLIKDGKTNFLNGWIITFLILYIIQRFYDPLYLNLQYAERTVLPLLMIFLYCYIKYTENNKIIYAIIALLSAVIVVYSKEVFSGCLLVFSATNLIFDKNLSKNIKKMNWLIIINSLLFYVVYLIVVVPYIEKTYYSGTGKSYVDLFIYILLNQKLIFVGFIVLIIRAYSLLINKDRNNVIFDSMLFSGMSIFFVSILLKLEYQYYYSPTIVLIAPALAYFSVKYFKHKLTLIIVLFFFGMYFYKIVPVIKTNQERRKTEYVKVRIVANLVKSGYVFYWYEVQTLKQNDYNLVYRNWNRDLIKDHLRFNLLDSTYSFKTIHSLSEIESKRSILLYSTFNDLINMKKSLIDKSALKSKEIFQIADIIVFKID